MSNDAASFEISTKDIKACIIEVESCIRYIKKPNYVGEADPEQLEKLIGYFTFIFIFSFFSSFFLFFFFFFFIFFIFFIFFFYYPEIILFNGYKSPKKHIKIIYNK